MENSMGLSSELRDHAFRENSYVLLMTAWKMIQQCPTVELARSPKKNRGAGRQWMYVVM
jgi:hypothetical protein